MTKNKKTNEKSRKEKRMPNHVMNELRFRTDGRTLHALLESIAGEKEGSGQKQFGTIDFDKIVPMPDELNIEASSKTFRAVEKALTELNPDAPWTGNRERKMDPEEFRSLFSRMNASKIYSKYRCDLSEEEMNETDYGESRKDMSDLGRKALSNFQKYGAVTWYEWRTDPKHWNTKWNAYDCEYAGNGVLRFQTAWSAPHPVMEALAKMHPDISFTHEWADEDIGYNCGKAEYRNGLRAGQSYPTARQDAIRFAEKLWEGPDDGYAMEESENGMKKTEQTQMQTEE